MPHSPRLPQLLRSLPLLLALGLSATAAAQAPAPLTITDDGAWCWFSDPRAIYHDGKIIAGWMTSDGSVVVGALDTATQKTEQTLLAEKFEIDDHDNPALLRLPDGNIATFYSRHAKGDMIMQTTLTPGDIGAWTPPRILGFDTKGRRGLTYANPVFLKEESRLYVFWRGVDFKPTFSVSDDEGKTWSAPRTLIRSPKVDDTNRPYVKVWNDGARRIDIVFTDGHPRNEPRNSLYYVRYENGAFFKADGTRIGTMDDLPLDPQKCDRIYDAHAGRAWVWDICGPVPTIVYTRHPEETDHRYHYARWDGAKWTDNEITRAGKWFPQTPAGATEPEPHYSAGVALDKFNDNVYLSRPVNGVFEIERWWTPDGGQTWRSTPVTENSTSAKIRPFVIRDAPLGEPWLLWMSIDGHYVHYTNYRTSIETNDTPRVTNHTPLSRALTPAAVLAAMERVGDWHIAHPARLRPDDWIAASGYTGVMELAKISADKKYLHALKRIAAHNQWRLGSKKYHADDHCVGQLYVDLYLRAPDPEKIAPMRKQFDEILATPKDGDLDFTKPNATDKWSWCDSLYMAPPAWAGLWRATGDRRYLDYAVSNWWRASAYLYSPEDKLFYRDSRYFEQREPNGEKIFWARGNGWVVAGIARMLEILPAGHESRSRFERQFKDMIAKIIALQNADGTWRASLLAPDHYPQKETSGTGFFCYAIAWGINAGLLDKNVYAPAAFRAWQALVDCVEPDGRLTHVQPVGRTPRTFAPRSTDAFGSGAFLLAGSEIHRLLESGK